jgi:CheY-like chemotaxis protein
MLHAARHAFVLCERAMLRTDPDRSAFRKGIAMDLGAERPLKVLCVDDEAILLADLAEELREEGCEVDELADGLAAHVKAMAEPFDCIVCDMTLPGLSGLEMLRRIRSTEGPNRLTQFILLTGSKDNKLKTDCERYSNAMFLLKPVDYSKLLSVLCSNHGGSNRASYGSVFL